MKKNFDVIVIGAGPSGIGASIYLKNEGFNVALIEKSTPGGKINIAPRVDNYPRFPPTPGPDLALNFYQRILDNKINFIGDEITSLTKEDDVFIAQGKSDTYQSKAIYIASGTSERKLGLPREDYFFGRGLSYCALCDGHFFKNQDVMVIGGGNTALKEAIYLSGMVHHLYLIHRRNEFRGSNKLVDELNGLTNVTILTPYIPLELIGENNLEAIKIAHRETHTEKIISLQGLFPLVGQNPNSDFIHLDIKDEWGNIPVDKNMATRVKGCFAGGDILPREIRQIYLAEHDGMVAGKNIKEYLGK